MILAKTMSIVTKTYSEMDNWSSEDIKRLIKDERFDFETYGSASGFLISFDGFLLEDHISSKVKSLLRDIEIDKLG